MRFAARSPPFLDEITGSLVFVPFFNNIRKGPVELLNRLGQLILREKVVDGAGAAGPGIIIVEDYEPAKDDVLPKINQ